MATLLRHLRPISRALRGTAIKLLEIGVWKGESLRMWREYFGPQARIIGMDVNPAAAKYANEGFEMFIGDQADKTFLEEVIGRIGSSFREGVERAALARSAARPAGPAT